MKKVIIIFLLSGWAFMLYSQSCLPDGITFWSQAEIDSFQYNYPNCTEIEGYLRIWGSDITNLNGLSGITSVGGEVEIYHQPLLTTFNGLNALAFIGGDLRINHCDAIVDLSGLDGLESVNGYVLIGATTMGSGNDLLQNISALNNLTYVGGFLQIAGNDSLTSLNGLENLSYLGDALVIYWCNSLPNLIGWAMMDTLPGLKLGYNNNLISLEGLETVSHISGSLFLEENSKIVNLEPLNNLTSVSGDVEFWGNSSLSNLIGLNNLTSIGGRIKFVANDRLTDMSALLNLTSITGEINIFGNDSLSTLHGLDNIDATSITDLSIAFNSLLSECEVQSVCDYLASPNGLVDISNNMVGCNSQAEVEEVCYVGISDQPSYSQLTTYPNPFTTSTTIEYELYTICNIQYTVYNMMGEMVFYSQENMLPPGRHKITWSPGHLPAGLYYGVLRSGEGVSVVKMLKQ